MLALAPPRHLCHACGGCCRGVVVRLADADDVARARAAGEALGVADPVVDGALRRVDGGCVFLGADSRCAIHAALGAEAKPRVCRQYPFVRVDDGADGRIGVDPGCYTAALTAREGPPLFVADALAVRALAPPELEAMERALILRVAPSDGVVLHALAALLPPAPGAGPERLQALIDRWHARLRAADLAPLVRRVDAGRSLGDALGPVLDFVAATPAAPRAAPLPAALDRAAVDAARALLFLRLARLLPPHANLLVMLLGAVTSAEALRAEAGVDPRAFAAALAGWSRAVRAPAFARALLPDEAALRELVGG